jgi:phosphatidylglycerol lysyltransferase
MGSTEIANSDRERVLCLIKEHGWNATSFQTLESHFQYWFDVPEACVAYVDTGSAWVAAGAPLGPTDALAAVARRFVEAGRRQGRRVCFFGTERRFVELSDFGALVMGSQPSWDPAAWPDTVQETSSLREQLRRARAKGVAVRAVEASVFAHSGALRDEIEAVLSRWQAMHPLPPMRFLVAAEPFGRVGEKRFWVAEWQGRVVGFLAAVPIYQRSGWLLEDLFRDPQAPNGTVELLVDAAMRCAHEEELQYVTLGMAPLSGPVGILLRIARRFGNSLYDFDGLRRFKLKLRPTGWTPIFLSVPQGAGRALAVYDVMEAFADGSIPRFLWRTLWTAPEFFVRLLALLLIPWTLALAVATPTDWFPTQIVRGGWIAFDVSLTLALLWLSGRWRRWLAMVVAGCTTLDAGLTGWQVFAFNLPRVHTIGHALAVTASVLAPTVAAAFLWRVVWSRYRRGARSERAGKSALVTEHSHSNGPPSLQR